MHKRYGFVCADVNFNHHGRYAWTDLRKQCAPVPIDIPSDARGGPVRFLTQRVRAACCVVDRSLRCHGRLAPRYQRQR